MDVRHGHDPKATLRAISPVVVGPRELLCLLEEGLHVAPSPAGVAELLPLVVVLAVAAEVQHPVEHAVELGWGGYFSELSQ